jgi:4-diphosphocytidyl-2-C-methyl-D-erythritol kinase
VHTGIHVATGPAYVALGRTEQYPAAARAIAEFQDYVRALSDLRVASSLSGVNDFEGPVFAAHPALRKSAQALKRAGSSNVRMSGSGSAIFGFFPTVAARDAAVKKIPGARAARLLSRAQSLANPLANR